MRYRGIYLPEDKESEMKRPSTITILTMAKDTSNYELYSEASKSGASSIQIFPYNKNRAYSGSTLACL